MTMKTKNESRSKVKGTKKEGMPPGAPDWMKKVAARHNEIIPKLLAGAKADDLDGVYLSAEEIRTLLISFDMAVRAVVSKVEELDERYKTIEVIAVLAKTLERLEQARGPKKT